MAILLILISGITGLVEGTLIKQYNSRHTKGGFLFTALVSLFSMLYFVITDTNGLQFENGIFPYAIVSGLLYCAASFLTFVALSCGSFTLSMLILSYSGVFTVLYGLLFLNETASLFTYVGFAIIVVSLYLVRGEKEDEDTKFSAKWLVCILISFFASGMFAVVQRMQQIRFNDAYTNEFMIVTLGLSAIILFVVGLTRDGKDLGYILKNGGLYATLAGLSNGATNGLGLVINTLIPISLSSPMKAGVKIILSFLLSVLIFKEHFLKRQILGVLLGTIALVFLNL